MKQAPRRPKCLLKDFEIYSVIAGEAFGRMAKTAHGNHSTLHGRASLYCLWLY